MHAPGQRLTSTGAAPGPSSRRAGGMWRRLLGPPCGPGSLLSPLGPLPPATGRSLCLLNLAALPGLQGQRLAGVGACRGGAAATTRRSTQCRAGGGAGAGRGGGGGGGGGGRMSSFEAWLAANPLPGTSRSSSSNSSSSTYGAGSGGAGGVAVESPPPAGAHWSRARQRGGSRQPQPPPHAPSLPPETAATAAATAAAAVAAAVAPMPVRRAWEFPVGATLEVLEHLFLGGAVAGGAVAGGAVAGGAVAGRSSLAALLTPAAAAAAGPAGSAAALARMKAKAMKLGSAAAVTAAAVAADPGAKPRARAATAATATLEGQAAAAAAAATAAAAAATAATAAAGGEGVQWDPSRRAFTAGGVRVVLPRLAPRPEAAAGRLGSQREGWEGWEAGGGFGTAVPAGAAATGAEGRRLLLSYVDQLRGLQQGQQQEQQQGQRRQLQHEGALSAGRERPRSNEMGGGGGGGAAAQAGVQRGVEQGVFRAEQELAGGEELFVEVMAECGLEGEEEDEDVAADVDEDVEDVVLLLEGFDEDEEDLASEEADDGFASSGSSGYDSSSSGGSSSSSGGGRRSGGRAGGGGGGPHPHLLQPVNTGMVLLSADSAVLAVWLRGRLVRHKVHTGYTVRHSAGGSQERHDRTGGGARGAGAALRRAEVGRLWSAAAATLNAWAPELAACEVLLRSGDSRVWASLYGVPAKPPPVDKRDARWEGAGVPVPRPRLRDAVALWALLCGGRVEVLGGPEAAGEGTKG